MIYGKYPNLSAVLRNQYAYVLRLCDLKTVKDRLTVVGLGGSLARRSTSLAALKIALAGAAGAGTRTEFLDLRELSLPMYDPENTEPPESVIRLCDAVASADGRPIN